MSVTAHPIPPPTAESVPALRVDGVSLARRGDHILGDVSLTVSQGDFLAVLGPNGGGKTTLLRLVLGLMKPDAGTIRVFGKAPAEARSRMGYVPQYATIRPDFPVSAMQVCLMGAAQSGNYGGRLWPEDAAAREKAMRALELLGIADLAAKPVARLSGGQRQRLLVARALMSRPESGPFLLLLDEPTASIDPEGKFCFYEFLGDMRGSITIIVVSHDLGMASPFFSHVAIVNRSLTYMPGGHLSEELLRPLIGAHAPDCPVGLSFRPHPLSKGDGQ